MKKNCTVPPDCCVIIEMEPGARLGYRKAVLLSEIDALESLTKAALLSKVTRKHARELIMQMNQEFSVPLVYVDDNSQGADHVSLSKKGKDVATVYWRWFEPIWNDIQQERRRQY